ncbi:MAG: hypothetical protein KF791_15615 [Verrucomicrobiae bacterium]|nr:hypothetical protein [Verrucomicrobiae bacterium]
MPLYASGAGRVPMENFASEPDSFLRLLTERSGSIGTLAPGDCCQRRWTIDNFFDSTKNGSLRWLTE